MLCMLFESLRQYDFDKWIHVRVILIRTYQIKAYSSKKMLPSQTHIPSASNIRIPQRTPQMIASAAVFAEERMSNFARFRSTIIGVPAGKRALRWLNPIYSFSSNDTRFINHYLALPLRKHEKLR